MASESSDRRLFLLAGPSAVGKTALSLSWAESLGAEILSCDAFCVYQGMDIGTAKPTKQEQARVPHHGLDLAPVRERFSVGRYAAYARDAAEVIAARGKPVLVVGGSGFYLRSFFAPVTDELLIPPEVRAEVEELEVREGLEGLIAALRTEVGSVGEIDWRNPRRVANALMRARVGGGDLRTQQARLAGQRDPFAGWQRECVVLTRQLEDLRARVAARTQAMLRAGLVDEVRALWDAGLGENSSAARAVGYRETLAYLTARGELPPEAGQFGKEAAARSEAELAEQVTRHTNQLIRKQRTWFRHQLPPHRELQLPPEPYEPTCPWA